MGKFWFKNKKEDNNEALFLPLSNKTIILNPLKFIEAMNLAKDREKLSKFDFLEKVLLKISNLSAKEILNLYIQEIIEVILYHRYHYLDNMPLSTKENLTVQDFMHTHEDNKLKSFKIGNFTHNFIITLAKCKDSYTRANRDNQADNLGLYIIASTCNRGIQEGIDNLSNNNDSLEIRNQLLTYNSIIGKSSNIKLDLLSLSEPLNIISKGDTGYALFFRDLTDNHFGF